MLSSHTNRRPPTRLARFASLSLLAPASILVASLQVGPASAAGPGESIGSEAEERQSAEPLSERIEELIAKAAALQAELRGVLGELRTALGGSDRDGDHSIGSMRDQGGFAAPTRIHGVAPVYPPEAVTAGVEGIVVLKATIGPTGEVMDVEVLHSVPLLDEAAMAAVREWRYEPMLVDGNPVRVRMTVSVDFTLTGR